MLTPVPEPYLQNYPVHVRRYGLTRTQAALAQGELRIGFIGGSITAPYRDTWPEGVIAWFAEHFPKVRLHATNVAIGATGSMSACLRAERDLIRHGCDLVFVEYAVNDRETDRDARRRTQEGLVRKLLAGPGRDVVFVYTYCQSFYEEMAAGKVPASVRDLDEVADHYHLSSAWMGLHAWNEVRVGRLRWEEWLPDGLHPKSRGSWSYAGCVNELLHGELISAPNPMAIPVGERRPAPLDRGNWETSYTLPLAKVMIYGPWVLRTSTHWFADEILETCTIGARLSFLFSGRGVCLGFDFGKTSAEFRYRFDGGEWQTANRERQAWCPESGWFRHTLLTESLPYGEHQLELEVIHGDRPDCSGTNFRLAQVGIVA
jgi:hypothetical protein